MTIVSARTCEAKSDAANNPANARIVLFSCVMVCPPRSESHLHYTGVPPHLDILAAILIPIRRAEKTQLTSSGSKRGCNFLVGMAKVFHFPVGSSKSFCAKELRPPAGHT